MNSETYDVKPLTSLEQARLPIFSGHMRDYYHWKAEWEDLQLLVIPHRLENVRKEGLCAVQLQIRRHCLQASGQ